MSTSLPDLSVAPPCSDEAERAAKWLLTPVAVSERCNNVYKAGLRDELEHFRVVIDRLPECAKSVVQVIEERFPDLDIPPHSRWRHFAADGRDLWRELNAALNEPRDEIARIRFDLAVTSVLLDAGAGPDWRYRHEPTGRTFRRSEGLALASLEAFRSGLFSSDPSRPLMADAEGLKALTNDRLAGAFQVAPDNPMTGVSGRAALLRRLGDQLGKRGLERPGDLFAAVKDTSRDGGADLAEVFMIIQSAFGELWAGRETLGGVSLGDTWRHPSAGGEGPGAGLVPFHKLMQWMCYSLIEPLEEAGLTVCGMELLTPLAEYRNGGLILDCGLIQPKHRRVFEDVHRPGDEIVVEWRALTVALISVLAEEIRDLYGMDEEELPLATILEGGTWWAGRKIAAEKRPDGGPPIRVVSDGTVF
jgi:hypothetical protein